jgi:hypothetical protein
MRAQDTRQGGGHMRIAMVGSGGVSADTFPNHSNGPMVFVIERKAKG